MSEVLALLYILSLIDLITDSAYLVVRVSPADETMLFLLLLSSIIMSSWLFVLRSCTTFDTKNPEFTGILMETLLESSPMVLVMYNGDLNEGKFLDVVSMGFSLVTMLICFLMLVLKMVKYVFTCPHGVFGWVKTIVTRFFGSGVIIWSTVVLFAAGIRRFDQSSDQSGRENNGVAVALNMSAGVLILGYFSRKAWRNSANWPLKLNFLRDDVVVNVEMVVV